MWSQAMGLLVAALEKVSKGTLTLSDVVSMIQSSLMLMGVPTTSVKANLLQHCNPHVKETYEGSRL